MVIWEAHWTFPGHEPDLAPLIRAFEWDMHKSLERELFIGQVGGDDARERVLASTLRYARRGGVPASRAWFEGDCIVVAVERPRGHG